MSGDSKSYLPLESGLCASTVQKYNAIWQAFRDWCEKSNVFPPYNPEHVYVFLFFVSHDRTRDMRSDSTNPTPDGEPII